MRDSHCDRRSLVQAEVDRDGLAGELGCGIGSRHQYHLPEQLVARHQLLLSASWGRRRASEVWVMQGECAEGADLNMTDVWGRGEGTEICGATLQTSALQW